MTERVTGTRSVVVDRELAHPPEKIWRALTQSHLIGEWLMETEFEPVVGHLFEFRSDWGTIDCRVVEVEPNKRLAYTWVSLGLDSVVTWTLSPTPSGTHLRMEQAGFQPDQQGAYKGAQAGWSRFFSALESTLAKAG